MNITVAVLVMNQREVTQQFLDQMRKTEGDTKLPLLIIDNGSNPPVRDWLIGLREGDFVVRNEENVGVMPAMNQAHQVLKNTSDFIFFVHNDVMVYEDGWAGKLVRVLSELPDCGVAGFYGAKAIGHPNIYNMPYEMSQLARGECVSACHRMNAAVHGFRPPRWEHEKVAVLDGFSLAVRTELLNKLGGFDRSYPIHHNYDNDICLESLNAGYSNYVIAMDAQHLGGRTDVGENWAEPFGKTKQQVHIDAHPVMYNKWHPDKVASGQHKICLPVRIP